MEKYLMQVLVELLKKMEVEKVLGELLKKAKEQFVCWLQMQAMASGTPLDDVAVEIIAKVLGVDAGSCKVAVPAQPQA